MNLDLSGAGAVTTNPFVILSNPEIAILHIELMVTILATNHRLTYSLSYPLQNMWGCVYSVDPFPLWWLREYIYFVLSSSSNRKYELLPIV